MHVTWATTKEFLAWIAIVSGGIKALEYLFSKTPIAHLKAEIDKMKAQLTDTNQLLKEHERELREHNRAIMSISEELAAQRRHLNVAIDKLGTSQISILNHMITGNGITELKQDRDDLTDFFVNRKDRQD